MSIFEAVTPTADSIFHKRNDPHDIRLGEIVLRHPEDYEMAAVILLGLPQDEGVARNGGRIGAHQAPHLIRQALYKFVAIPGLSLFDLGDTHINNTLEATHKHHRKLVEQILRDGKTLVVLGGGNDTSYPDVSALSDVVSRDLLAFNIDAHFDVRIAERPNSGTPYRQLLEENYIRPQNFHEVAYNPSANSTTYLNYLRQKGVHLHELAVVQQIGITSLLAEILLESNAQAIFWGIDMDVVNVSQAPGVSAPNMTGLSAHDLISIASLAGRDPRTRLFEITEVNPVYDIDERTSRLAAVAIWHFLSEQTTF